MAQLSKPCLPTFKSNSKSSDSVLSSLAIHRTDPRGFFSSLAVKKKIQILKNWQVIEVISAYASNSNIKLHSSMANKAEVPGEILRWVF